MSRSQSNIKVDPAKVFFVNKATFCVAVEANTANALDGLYWELNGAAGTNYYVWYNGGGADPAPVGRTGIAVVVSSGWTAKQVATATAAAIEAEADFNALVNPGNAEQVIVKTATYADAAIPAAGTTTGHGFIKVHEGFEYDFGYTDGDLEVSLDQALLDISAHQTGTNILTSLVTGNNVEISIAFKEYSAGNLQKLIAETSGGAFTPGGGTEVIGYGAGQNSNNTLDKSARLVLHPARLVDTDRSEDLCLLLAYPKPDSITISGENPKLLNFTFRVYEDSFVNAAVNKVAIGDHLQL